MTNTTSALTTILDTVAPPISAHETLELWLSHPMTGYDGVEGVIYRAWTRILEQTESGELVVVWSAPESAVEGKERNINPCRGWEEGWKIQTAEIEAIKSREEKNPKGRGKVNRMSPSSSPSLLPSPPLRLISLVLPSLASHPDVVVK